MHSSASFCVFGAFFWLLRVRHNRGDLQRDAASEGAAMRSHLGGVVEDGRDDDGVVRRVEDGAREIDELLVHGFYSGNCETARRVGHMSRSSVRKCDVRMLRMHRFRSLLMGKS